MSPLPFGPDRACRWSGDDARDDIARARGGPAPRGAPRSRSGRGRGAAEGASLRGLSHRPAHRRWRAAAAPASGGAGGTRSSASSTAWQRG